MLVAHPLSSPPQSCTTIAPAFCAPCYDLASLSGTSRCSSTTRAFWTTSPPRRRRIRNVPPCSRPCSRHLHRAALLQEHEALAAAAGHAPHATDVHVRALQLSPGPRPCPSRLSHKRISRVSSTNRAHATAWFAPCCRSTPWIAARRHRLPLAGRRWATANVTRLAQPRRRCGSTLAAARGALDGPRAHHEECEEPRHPPLRSCCGSLCLQCQAVQARTTRNERAARNATAEAHTVWLSYCTAPRMSRVWRKISTESC